MKQCRKAIALLLSLTLMLSIFAGLPASAQAQSDVTVYGMLTDDLTNPVGLDNATPAFSWKMQSDVVGQRQTAYRLEVSKQSGFDTLVWDSGRVESDDSVAIPYEGQPLEESTTYYWRVTVWDKDGAAAQSEPATFEMGLLGEDAWDGTEWIQVDDIDTMMENDALHYTVEADLTITQGAMGLVFNATDKNNLYMWQLNAGTEGKLMLNPHVKKGGKYTKLANYSVDVTDAVAGGVENIIGTAQRLKVDISKAGIRTYLNGALVSEIPADALTDIGIADKIERIGFRVQKEAGLADNVQVTDYSVSEEGTVVASYDFEDGENPFIEGTVEDGQLSLAYGTDETLVWNANYSPDGKAGPLHYTVEADVICTNKAVGVIFSATDSNNFYMWQFNTTSGSIQLKPHTWADGAYGRYPDYTVDISEAAGSVEDFAKNPVHLKVDVTPDQITTYINGVYIHTMPVGLLSSDKTVGNAPVLGKIGVRTSTSDGEKGYVDNLKLTDYTESDEGKVVYYYTFDENPFLIGEVVNGVYFADANGVVLPEDKASAFRKEFAVEEDLVSAKLYTAGLGVYNAFVNGERVGRLMDDGSMRYDELKPGYTEASVRKFYHSYDVTQMIKAGESNVLSAISTSGWWSDYVIRYYGKKNAFRAKLVLTYSDGSEEIIGTDTTWKASHESPVQYANIFLGEIYDATVSTDFMMPGFDDTAWDNAIPNTEFDGVLCAHIGTPVIVRDDLEQSVQSVSIYDGVEGANTDQYGKVHTVRTYQGGESFTLNPGETAIVDFGQNFAGWEAFTVEGEAGTWMKIRHAEMLNDNNGLKTRGNDGPEGSVYTTNLRTAAATTKYRLGGGVESYHPLYSYYGFRYLEITADAPITIHSLSGQVVTSVEYDSGSLTTSDEDLNQLFSNVQWSYYSNYLSIPTDCPQRDERCGWTADTQAFAITASYFSTSTKSFLRKWLQDMRDSQLPDGQYWSAVPVGKNGYNTGQFGWADAGIIVPYNLYKMFGDKSLIEEHYASMQLYMDDYLASTDKKGGGHNYGDWLSVEANDEALKELLAVAFFAWDAQMMAEMAEVMGKPDDAAKYQAVYEEEKEYFQQLYVNDDGTLVNGKQTACLFALRLGLLPNEASEQKVLDQLITNIESNGYKVQTGFLGTSILMPSLSDLGQSDIAYKLLFQHESPSWLNAVDQGATTIWERWDSYDYETGFKSGSMSFNHYSYGVVAEWMYSYLAGIKYDAKNPGFQHFILQPTPNQSLEAADGSYESIYGLIESRWNYDGDIWNYEATVPANTSATVKIPVEDLSTLTINGKAADAVTTEEDGIAFVGMEDGKAVFEAVAGSFRFSTKVTIYNPCSVRFELADSDLVPAKATINGKTYELPVTLDFNEGEEIAVSGEAYNTVDYTPMWKDGDGNVLSETPEYSFTVSGDTTVSMHLNYTGYKNLAIGAAVDAEQANASWAAKNLTDGILTHLGGTQGWSSKKQPADLVFPEPIVAVVDLGEEKTFDRFQLYPRTSYWGPDEEPVNFLKAYSILVSNDGIDYHEVYSTENETTNGWNPVVVQLDELVTARYVKLSFTESNQFGDTTTGSYIQLSEFGVYNTQPEVSESITAPGEATANELFTVTAVTRDDVANVALFNENGLKLGLKEMACADNGDGTLTWTFQTAIGTVGKGRTLTLATIDVEGVYTLTEASFTMDVKAAQPEIISAEMEEEAVVNEPVILRVVTSKDVQKIEVENENGLKMGTLSQKYEDTGEGREWTIEMKIGTQGTRSFLVRGKNVYGDVTSTLETNPVTVLPL